MSELKAIVFDFDGVIADTERLHLAGFLHALAAWDIDVTEAEYFARYAGFDDRDAFRAMLVDHGKDVTDETVVSLIEAKANAFEELVRERARIFPGVSELILSLSAPASGDSVALAVASGALRSEIELVLRLHDLLDAFPVIVSADDVARSKPDPETYRLALERLSAVHGTIDVAAAVAIEDTRAGIASAEAAGLWTLGVTNTYAAEELPADWVVSTLEGVTRGSLEKLLISG